MADTALRRNGRALDIGDQPRDVAGGLCRSVGELADFVGDDGETAAGFTRTRRFDGGVECQEVGLVGNLLDQLDDAADLLGTALQTEHFFQRAARVAGEPVQFRTDGVYRFAAARRCRRRRAFPSSRRAGDWPMWRGSVATPPATADRTGRKGTAAAVLAALLASLCGLQAVVARGLGRRQLLAQRLILLLELAEARLKAADFSPASENHFLLLTVMTSPDHEMTVCPSSPAVGIPACSFAVQGACSLNSPPLPARGEGSFVSRVRDFHINAVADGRGCVVKKARQVKRRLGYTGRRRDGRICGRPPYGKKAKRSPFPGIAARGRLPASVSEERGAGPRRSASPDHERLGQGRAY
jgi:hypothetical protein